MVTEVDGWKVGASSAAAATVDEMNSATGAASEENVAVAVAVAIVADIDADRDVNMHASSSGELPLVSVAAPAAAGAITAKASTLHSAYTSASATNDARMNTDSNTSAVGAHRNHDDDNDSCGGGGGGGGGGDSDGFRDFPETILSDATEDAVVQGEDQQQMDTEVRVLTACARDLHQ